MKYLSIYKTVERNCSPSQEEMDRMGKLVEEGMKSGYLLAVEGCLPTAHGRAGAPVQRQRDGDGWTIHGIKGSDRRLRDPAGELERRGDPNDAGFSSRGR